MDVHKLLEKLGYESFDIANNTTKQTFDDVMDMNIKKELLLIQQVRLSNDFLAEEQLIAMYRGILNKVVNESKAKQIVGYDQTYQRAVSALKTSIRNFNLKSYKNNKPSTYFMKNIMLELDKFYKQITSQGTIKMSSENNRYKNIMVNAESILVSRLGRKPTNNELLNFIKNEFKLSQNLDLETIERIEHYTTQELSGSKSIGKNNADGAEELSYEDVMNGTQNVDDILKKENTANNVINAIRSFTADKNQRKFLMCYLGIGEFSNAMYKGNIHNAAINCGVSYYVGCKILENFRTFCVNKGVL